MLCYAMLCYAMLCYAMLCYASCKYASCRMQLCCHPCHVTAGPPLFYLRCSALQINSCCPAALAAGLRMPRRMGERGMCWTPRCACCASCLYMHLCWSSRVGTKATQLAAWLLMWWWWWWSASLLYSACLP